MLPILIPSVLIGLRYYGYTLGFLGMAFMSVLRLQEKAMRKGGGGGRGGGGRGEGGSGGHYGRFHQVLSFTHLLFRYWTSDAL